MRDVEDRTGKMGGGVTKPQIPMYLTMAEKGMCEIPRIADQGVIAHYMPPTFPLEIFLTQTHLDACRRTWKLIVTGQANGMQASQGRSGIVLFYDEFYFRLFQRAKVFKNIFPNMQKRGEVLTKAMGFMLKLTGDNSQEECLKLATLGHEHQAKTDVRPWHFPSYCEVALEVLMFWLGTDATIETGEAWTVLIAYVLQRMLGTFLIGKTDRNEFYQNSGANNAKSKNQPPKGTSIGGSSKARAKAMAEKAEAAKANANGGGAAAGPESKTPKEGEEGWVPLHVRKEWAKQKAEKDKAEKEASPHTAEKKKTMVLPKSALEGANKSAAVEDAIKKAGNQLPPIAAK